MSGLTLEQASLIVDATLAHGRAEALQPLCVAVLDTGGVLLALKREEQAGLLRPDIAVAKAYGALGMGFGSREIGRRAAQNPVFFNALVAVSGGRMAPSAGGVLIRDARGVLIGAVGVSGDVADRDEACALVGIAAAEFQADPGAPG